MAIIQTRLRLFLPVVATVTVVVSSMTAALAAEYKLIAYKTVAASSLSRSEVQAIFLGEKSRWDDGKPIKIVLLDGGAVHQAFLQSVLGKTPVQFETYWKKLVFTGKGTAPKAFAEPAEVVDYVGTHPGAIGYVAADQTVGSLKKISIK